jgi:hypothetical protein
MIPVAGLTGLCSDLGNDKNGDDSYDRATASQGTKISRLPTSGLLTSLSVSLTSALWLTPLVNRSKRTNRYPVRVTLIMPDKSRSIAVRTIYKLLVGEIENQLRT